MLNQCQLLLTLIQQQRSNNIVCPVGYMQFVSSSNLNVHLHYFLNISKRYFFLKDKTCTKSGKYSIQAGGIRQNIPNRKS